MHFAKSAKATPASLCALAAALGVIVPDQEPLEAKIGNWLEGQGYPLEMNVARKLRSLGLNIRQGWHYDDIEEGASREIDIVASKLDRVGGYVEIHFVIECKATSKPWIIFTNDRVGDGINIVHSAGLFSKAALDYWFGGNNIPFDVNFFEYKKYLQRERLGYALTQAFGDSKDPTYQALLSCFKASLALQKKSPWFNKEGHWTFIFPVVITSSPLFECYLDKDNEMQIASVDSADLLFTKRVQNSYATNIRVVSSAGLESFVGWVNELSSKLFQALEHDMRKRLEDDIERTRGDRT
jgi:hypothetical protein